MSQQNRPIGRSRARTPSATGRPGRLVRQFRRHDRARYRQPEGRRAKTTTVHTPSHLAEKGQLVPPTISTLACLTFSNGVDPDQLEAPCRRHARRPTPPTCCEGRRPAPAAGHHRLAGAGKPLFTVASTSCVAAPLLASTIILVDCPPSLGILINVHGRH
jgi:hypothetical protein